MTQDIEQRSDEWFAARCGSLGASQIADAVYKTKSGEFGSTSDTIKIKLVVERLTGVQEDGFKNAAMQWGIDNEDAARLAYEARSGDFVTEVGLYRHPFIKGTHASPDGLVNDDGLVEIKCPNSGTHIETLKSGKVAKKYLYQMQWQMACAEREWCDFVSYDPRLPEELQLCVKRIKRDDKLIAELEDLVNEFLRGVDEDVEALETLAGKTQTATVDAS